MGIDPTLAHSAAPQPAKTSGASVAPSRESSLAEVSAPPLTSAAEVKPPVSAHPQFLQIRAYFSVLAPGDVTISRVDEVRREVGGDGAVAILYDVSPVRTTPQELSDALAEHPDVIVCDHHNGAAPLQEAPGKELTGAELVASTLQSLWERGLLQHNDGSPVSLVGVTHSGNVDPDSLICRVLIDTFANPTLREYFWTPERLETLIQAARFGDTTFFGGIAVEEASYETLKDHEKLALAILQLIIDQKAALVVEHCRDVAILRKRALELHDAEQSVETRPAFRATVRFLSDTATPEDLNKWLTSRGVSPESVIAEQSRLLQQAAQAEAFDGDRQYHDVLREHQERFVFSWAARRDLRSVLASAGEAAVAKLFESLGSKVIDAVRYPERFKPKVERFLNDLKALRKIAESKSLVVNDKVAVTVLAERLDRDPKKPQALQRFPIYDWLREAAASFGAPWLHVMDRKGHLVLSSRFPKAKEVRPLVNLAHPDLVADIKALEDRAFALAAAQGKLMPGEKPSAFIIKNNLVLPTGVVHFVREEAVALLLKHYDQIVVPTTGEEEPLQRVLPEVLVNGELRPFTGDLHFRLARGVKD